MVSDLALVTGIAGRFLSPDTASRWLKLLRPAVALRHAEPGEQVAAVLGGIPRLPESASWPVWEEHGPLSFIAAIDCAALAAVPLDVALPQAGILLFFYFDGQYDNYATTVGFWDPPTLAGARVLHIPAGVTTSLREFPTGLKPYELVELAAEPVWTFPGLEHPDLQAAFMGPGEDLRSFLDHPVNGDEFRQALYQRHVGPCHQVGGYAMPVQGPVEYEVALAALGGSEPGDSQRLKAEQSRWTLLAQIDSDDRGAMMWGDCGILYWLARKEDMTGSRLPPTSFTWQCS